MNRTIACLIFLLVLSPTARATVMVAATPVPPAQVGTTAQVKVGLMVRGETSGTLLSVGGGYTLTCAGQANGSIEAERGVAQTNLFVPGIVLQVTVPQTIPAQYTIQGWSSWEGGSIHECAFRYRGRAIEASSGISGGGFGFTFGSSSGQLEATDANTAQFVMLKPIRNAGGCDPWCTCTP